MKDIELKHSELFEKKIWTIQDVISFTGYAYSTLMRMTSRREIPFRKKGKKLYFFPDEILNWIDEGD